MVQLCCKVVKILLLLLNCYLYRVRLKSFHLVLKRNPEIVDPTASQTINQTEKGKGSNFPSK